MMRFASMVLALCLAWGTAAHAQNGLPPDNKPKVNVSLIAERPAVAPGGTVTVLLREDIRPGWHTYWKNPGDAGVPTILSWQLAEGWKAGDIQWPYPTRLPVGPKDRQLMNFGFQHQVLLLTDITVPANAAAGPTIVAADVMYLVCTDEAGVCVPEETHVNLPMEIAAADAPADPANTALFAAAREQLPKPSPWPAVFQTDGKTFSLLIESPALAAARPREAWFYPYKDAYLKAAAPEIIGTADKGLVITTETDKKFVAGERPDMFGGLLVLTDAQGKTEALDIQATPGIVPAVQAALAADSGIGIGTAMLFALLGGLILNLMPCVFPVLSMKAIALSAKAGAPSAAKLSALAYGAGIVVSFAGLASALLALRAGGAAIGWGFQLQHPFFVTLLALIMFAVGLNLSGLYSVEGGRFAGMGQRFANKSGALGSFFTGVLAVVVATPCTAPFMGAAMSFALTQSAALALSVFVALAIGFAAPFVLLGFWPAALRALPRPGPWMDTLRQILAFPMYGAAVWLTWVLAQQTGSDGLLAALISALVLAFALWAVGASQRSYGVGRIVGPIAAVIALAVMALLLPRTATEASQPAVPSADTLGYEAYSPEKLASVRAEGRPVFINATAAWCITCLVNEKVALSGTAVASAFRDKNVALLKADWTNQDAAITQLLAANGRSGVPLYLYYPAGAAEPKVLPQILTESAVIAALN